MDTNQPPHLSCEQLARVQDGEALPHEADHFKSCPDCRDLLRDMEAAEAAYAEYQGAIREPRLLPAPKPWRSLSALVAQDGATRQPRALLWWPAAAGAVALCVLVTLLLLPYWTSAQATRQTNELLARSVTAP